MINRRTVLFLGLVSCLLLCEQRTFAQSPGAGEASFARQAVRIDQLETEIRRLTGQNESVDFKIDQLERQLKSLKDAINSAAVQIERLQQLKPSAQAAPNGKPGKTPKLSDKKDSLRSLTPVPGVERGARALGVLRTRTGAALKPVDPSERLSPAQLYEKAQNFLTKAKEFQRAVELLQIFLVKYPEHKLAPNAYYWLSRAHFVRRNFQKASFAFAEGLQKFPKAPKASAYLLNLGMAFLKLGKKREACTTWGQLAVAYPSAPDATKRRVERERKKANCF